MGAVFQLIADTPVPAPGVRKISVPEAGLLLEAGEIIDAAKARATEITRKTEEDYARRMEEGYREGREASRLEHMEKILDTVMSSVSFIERMENSVVDVVNQAVRKVVGELPDDERITRIVKTALSNLSARQRVTVRVAPEDEKVLRRELADMLAEGRGAFLEIAADARLGRGSCLMESDLGIVDAGLETQLEALRRAFAARIRPE